MGIPYLTDDGEVKMDMTGGWTSKELQRSAKVLVRGMVKFVPASEARAGTNLTKPRTKALADLCMSIIP